MSIVFNNKPGILADVEFSLFFIYNLQWFEEKMENFEVKIDKGFMRNIKELKKKVDCEKVYMKVFFSTDIFGGMDRSLSLPCLDKSKLWNMESYEELINSVKESSEESIKKSIISQLLDLKDRSNELNEVLKEDKKVIELIESLECEASTKWTLFNFLNNIKKYMEEYIEFLNKYIKEYDKVINKRMKEIETFNDYIETNIDKGGKDFLRKAIGGIWEPDDYKRIYVSTMCINAMSCAAEERGDTIYIFIGSHFEETLKQINGADKVSENVSLFKGLGDMTRFNILKLLIEKEVYGQEIADAVGISMATVNYHMTFLMTTKVVQLKRNGQKTYYSLNKERLKEGIEFIEKTFKLEK